MAQRSDDDLMRRLLVTFAGEAEERLQTLNHDVLALERTADPAETEQLLQSMFRDAHSLKGAARAVSLGGVERLSHKLESFLERLQHGELQADAAVCDAIYRVIDGIAALTTGASAGNAIDVDFDALEARLDDPFAKPVAVDAPATSEARSQPQSEPQPPTKRPIQLAPPTSPQPVPQQPAPHAQPVSAEETVRMAVSKLDALMAGVGELLVALIGTDQRVSQLHAMSDDFKAWEASWRKARRQFGSALQDVPGADTLLELLGENESRLRASRTGLDELCRLFSADGRRMSQVAAELEDDVHRARMLPVSTVLDAFGRMVRDIAHENGKDIVLMVEGGETEVDRSVLEQLRSPLTHLVRNSVDHGLEAPDVRERAGKSARGTITVSASRRGGSLLVEVSDDGAGIDISRVRASAVAKGIVSEDVAESMAEREVLGLIFRSGLSTARMITDLSGRGVGLDVVRENVERMHGMIDVESTPATGTRFVLTVPLSVSTIRCVLARAGGQVFALPISNVARVVHVARDQIHSAEGRPVIKLGSDVVVLVDLAVVLGIASTPSDTGKQRIAIVTTSHERHTAFLVDELTSVQDMVTKSLPAPLMRVRHISGASILGTGEVVTVLNTADLVRTSRDAHSSVLAADVTEAVRTPVIMVVDDSLTTRTLEKNILEASGFEVVAAADGLEGWTRLQSGGVDLVVSDVQMPRMDGFDLTARIRSDERLRDLPVILVTSLDSRADRERGAEVGADAYIVKGAFEQDQLVETIRRLI